MKKKVFSIILSFAMVITMMPYLATPVMATSPNPTCDHSTWTAWGNGPGEATSLPSEAGDYYLNNDILITPACVNYGGAGRWIIEDGTTMNLCLNGHVVIWDVRCGHTHDSIIINEGATLNLFDCNPEATHQGDFSNYTGGLITSTGFGDHIYNEGTFNMYGGSIVENSHTEAGGGLYNEENANFTMYNGCISNNSSDLGGGIYNKGNVKIYGGKISNNYTNWYSREGGGIYNDGGSLEITNASIDHNSSKYGGGIYSTSGMITISNSDIVYNTAENRGGGIENEDSNCTIIDSNIKYNSAERGAGIYQDEDGECTVNTSYIESNNSSNLGGGYI